MITYVTNVNGVAEGPPRFILTVAGFEPATNGLKVRCATVAPHGRRASGKLTRIVATCYHRAISSLGNSGGKGTQEGETWRFRRISGSISSEMRPLRTTMIVLPS